MDSRIVLGNKGTKSGMPANFFMVFKTRLKEAGLEGRLATESKVEFCTSRSHKKPTFKTIMEKKNKLL